MTRNPIAAALAVLVLAAGCGSEGTAGAPEGVAALPAEADALARIVPVTALDFRFRTPTRIPEGLTTFRLDNQGGELHHVQLLRLEDGHDTDELLRALAAGGAVPAWAHEAGGPNASAPGGEAETTVDLEAGTYAMICFIPSADGVPHFMKGMALTVEVTPDARPDVGEPAADVRMVLDDYAFGVGEIPAGRRTIRVENAADQAHEVVIVQLAPGKTAQDLLAWAGTMQGPPPGRPIGGTTGLAKGEVNFVTADFAPGEYALVCFVSDAKDGRPHVAHGMVRQITVE